MSDGKGKRFDGEVIALMGSATGLGQAAALQLASEGANLALGDVNESGVEAVAQAARELGADVICSRVDVSDAQNVQAFADRAVSHFGTIDRAWMNAGVNECPAPAWELESNDWQWVLGVNLFGVVNSAKAFIPIFLKQGHGHFISTASNSSLVSTSGVAAYVASKKANLGYCEALQQDLRGVGSNVRVSAICSGKIMSNMPDCARLRPESLAGRAPSEDELVAMRAFLADGGKTPEEVAAAALDDFLVEGKFHILTHEDDGQNTIEWAQRVAKGELAPLGDPPPAEQHEMGVN